MTELVIFYESKSMFKFLKAEEIKAQLNIAKRIANQAIEQKRKDINRINRIIENIDALRPFAATQVSNSTEISPKQKAVLATVMTELVTFDNGKSIYKFFDYFQKDEEIQLNIAKIIANQVIEQKQEDINRIIENIGALRKFAATQVSESTEFSPKQKAVLLTVMTDIVNQVYFVAKYDKTHPLFD
jgi:copper chaperone CopZ